jgi:hypothetical protein
LNFSLWIFSLSHRDTATVDDAGFVRTWATAFLGLIEEVCESPKCPNHFARESRHL